MRVHVGTTFIAIVIAFVVAFFLLEDVVIVEEGDEKPSIFPEEAEATDTSAGGRPCSGHAAVHDSEDSEGESQDTASVILNDSREDNNDDSDNDLTPGYSEKAQLLPIRNNHMISTK